MHIYFSDKKLRDYLIWTVLVTEKLFWNETGQGEWQSSIQGKNKWNTKVKFKIYKWMVMIVVTITPLSGDWSKETFQTLTVSPVSIYISTEFTLAKSAINLLSVLYVRKEDLGFLFKLYLQWWIEGINQIKLLWNDITKCSRLGFSKMYFRPT